MRLRHRALIGTAMDRIDSSRRPSAMLLAVFIGATLAVAAPRAARADAAAASALFDEGKALFAAGRYREAREKLQASYDLGPLSGTAGLLAACHERTGQLASAWARYRESAVLAERSGNQERAAIARAKADQLETQLARLQIDPPARGRGPAIDGLVVTRNGQRIPDAALASPMPVDAGRHVVVASAPGRRRWSATIEIADGERRVVAIAPLRPLVALAPRPADRGRGRATQAWIGLGLAGAGGAALLAGGGFAIAAAGDWNEARDAGCTGRGACPDERSRDLGRTAAGRADLATALVGGGLALAATGLILWWTAPDGDGEAAPSAGVSALLGRDSFAVALEGRF